MVSYIDFSDTTNTVAPDYDATSIDYGDDLDAEPETVPEDRAEQISKAISTLPALRDIVIDPDYYSDHENTLPHLVCAGCYPGIASLRH